MKRGKKAARESRRDCGGGRHEGTERIRAKQGQKILN
jgi:hypothetical protein